ncbi:MAG: hypothetical protein V2J08_16005 [Desulfotignum sp.]|nr:hypothetical protein [Desulfotignum sp.]
MLVILAACDEKEDPYPGFSSLVAERHELRKSIAKERQGEKAQSQDAEAAKEIKTEKPTAVVYERQIEITDAASGKPLAKGTAYLNKEGKITRIRIYNQ